MTALPAHSVASVPSDRGYIQCAGRAVPVSLLHDHTETLLLPTLELHIRAIDSLRVQLIHRLRLVGPCETPTVALVCTHSTRTQCALEILDVAPSVYTTIQPLLACSASTYPLPLPEGVNRELVCEVRTFRSITHGAQLLLTAPAHFACLYLPALSDLCTYAPPKYAANASYIRSCASRNLDLYIMQASPSSCVWEPFGTSKHDNNAPPLNLGLSTALLAWPRHWDFRIQ